MSLLYGGSFSSVFKMFKQRVYEIDNDTWSNRGVAWSINVANVSTGTSAASDDSLQISFIPSLSHDNRPITYKICSWNFSISWSVEIALCDTKSVFVKSSSRSTSCRFDGTRFSVNIFRRCPYQEYNFQKKFVHKYLFVDVRMGNTIFKIKFCVNIFS